MTVWCLFPDDKMFNVDYLAYNKINLEEIDPSFEGDPFSVTKGIGFFDLVMHIIHCHGHYMSGHCTAMIT